MALTLIRGQGRGPYTDDRKFQEIEQKIYWIQIALVFATAANVMLFGLFLLKFGG